ncbi:DUF5668 domain-containing protein [uncultured Mucilaginibacter sp.]|uniref:LiaF transmembrane domain-containing protein n=1 Tax=uncultured Mucilaginibacter sp. TaxID=797541 RepID=UPI0025F4C67D|nr:DUF5668 domain-containing protein [uncultured Mucilaginibacter sp.]
MENNSEYSNPRHNNRLTLGIILLGIGIVYLLNQVTFFSLPFWLFSWPMWMILIGFASGVKHNFTKPGAIIMMAIGGIFLANMALGFHYMIFWPLMLIGAGIYMLFVKGSKWERNSRYPYGQYGQDVYGKQPDNL